MVVTWLGKGGLDPIPRVMGKWFGNDWGMWGSVTEIGPAAWSRADSWSLARLELSGVHRPPRFYQRTRLALSHSLALSRCARRLCVRQVLLPGTSPRLVQPYLGRRYLLGTYTIVTWDVFLRATSGAFFHATSDVFLRATSGAFSHVTADADVSRATLDGLFTPPPLQLPF